METLEQLRQQLTNDLKNSFLKRASDTDSNRKPLDVIGEVSLMLATNIADYSEKLLREIVTPGYVTDEYDKRYTLLTTFNAHESNLRDAKHITKEQLDVINLVTSWFGFDPDENAVYVKNKYNFYAEGGVSAKGFSAGGSGGGGGMDEELLWSILGDGDNPNKQIALSHLDTLLKNINNTYYTKQQIQANYLTASEISAKYISKDAFPKIFSDEMAKWFKKDEDGNIYAEVNFYSTQGISAKGLGSGSGGGGGMDEELLWAILGDGENPDKQIAISHLSTALSNYATHTWVTDKHYATEAWVTAKKYATIDWVNETFVKKADYTDLWLAEMDKWFKKDDSGNIYTEVNFYSNKGVSAKGLDASGGGGGGMDEELLWSILGDGENPNKQIALTHLTTALSGYYTSTQVNSAINDAVKYYIPTSQKGVAGGVAPLGSDGLISSSFLPSYVDDVLEFASLSAFPSTGESGKIYIAVDTNLTYRWSGTQYVEVSKSLALGETESTAYAGNKGAANRADIDKLKRATFWGASYQSDGNVYGTFTGTKIILSDLIETPKIKIGDAFIEYDAERTALKVVRYLADGTETVASLYATGGISARGFSPSGGGGGGGAGSISLNGTLYESVDGVITLPNLKLAEPTIFNLNNSNGNVEVRTPGRTGYYEFWDIGSKWASLVGKSFIVSGGTSSQFLKADGSVDGNLYITQTSSDSRYVMKTGDIMSGRLTGPSFRASNMMSVGSPVEQLSSSRAELHIITPGNSPCDIWLGSNNQRNWSITARHFGENYQLGIYNNRLSNWNAFFRDNANELTFKTEIRDVFLVNPVNIVSGDYNEGIRVTTSSDGWSNIQFGAGNSWNGKIDGQWVVGRNPVKYFQICLAGTETANTSKPGKGISIDINGYLDTGYIRPNIDTEYKAAYFYASDDSFIRRTTWDYALNCLNQNQLTLDLSSLDSNKWYPCTINAPAYGGTPLRITIFTGLRGNKPSWASNSSGFSLLLDYYVTGSGWGTLSAVSKLDWYYGSYGGETAFGGRQQNTMGSAEIVYLRGGGVYYYRTTNHGRLTVHPNGYSWANGSYTYSAAVKTSQDNSPMEKTFDQVYWAPNNLRNTRTIWGQYFNGTQNVSGALSGATTITATGDITTSANIRGRSIYASADLTAAGYTYCNGRLYVDRGRFSITATPTISLAIGDTDTGLHWQADGIIEFRSNAKQVGYWRYTNGRLFNCYFREPSGNSYDVATLMINGNGSNISPSIGFHQPGVVGCNLRIDNGGNFLFEDASNYKSVYAYNFVAAGWLYSTANSCEVRIGSQNASYVHITNNKSRPYYMDNRLDISGHVIPYSANIYDLGESGKPWRQAYINNMHGSADAAGMLNTAYIGGQQPNPQTYFNNITGLKVAMTGVYTNGAYWSDTLWINGYHGDDVPKCTTLHFPRDGSAEMYISSQESKSTSYGAVYRIWSSKNSNRSDAAWICSTLNASGRITCADVYSSSWLRTVGQTGWYSESYGGGWYMTDSTWIRAYNNKQIYTASTSADAIHTAGGMNASGRIYAGSYMQAMGGINCAGILNSGGASGFNVYATFHGNGDHGGIEIAASDNVLGIGVHKNDAWYMWWTPQGSVGNSSLKSYIFEWGANNWRFTGNIIATGEVTAYSDARLKSNIHTLDYRGRLIPRHYVKDGKQSIGFIAQEVQALYPELVLG